MKPENPISNKAKTSGGREMGQVHEPTQAQQASGNMGLADTAGSHAHKGHEKGRKDQKKGPSRKTA